MKYTVLFIVAVLAAQIAFAGALVRTPGGGTIGTPEGGENAILTLDFWGKLEDQSSSLEVGAEVMAPKFTVKDRLGKQYSKTIAHVLPIVDYAEKYNERTAWGIVVHTPFGLGTSMGDNRDQLGFDTQTLISRTDIVAGVDIRIDDEWRLCLGGIIGVPMVIYKAPFDLNRRPLPIYTNNKAIGDPGFGGAIALIYEPSDRFAVGIEYDSEMTTRLNGKSKISVGPIVIRDSFEADLEFPSILKLAFRSQATDRLEIMGDAGFVNYSKTANAVVLEFDKLMIHKPLSLKWQDTNFCHLGANYKLNNRFTVRAGVGWLSQGIPDSTIDSLTIDVPGYDVAIGATYKPNENTAVNLAFTHAWGKNSVGKGWRKKEYEVDINTFSTSVSFGFSGGKKHCF